MKALEIAHLTKRYGSFTALDNASLSIDPGTIYGLLGRNGAGKSTAIACSLNLTRATSGEVTFFGQRLQPKLFERIVYVPEINVLEGWMTAREHAAFRAGMFLRFEDSRYRHFLERFEIPIEKRVRAMSKGQRQGVAVALAFAQRPDVMILDEPGSGLDPLMQRRLLDAMVDVAADGTTILFSSHHIAQVEVAAERVAIIDRGKIVYDADLDETRASRSIVEGYFATAPDPELIRAAFGENVRIDGPLVRVPANGDTHELRTRLASFQPAAVNIRNMTLEQIFFSAIGAIEEQARV